MIVEGKVKSRACNIPVVDIVELSYNEVKVGIVLALHLLFLNFKTKLN